MAMTSSVLFVVILCLATSYSAPTTEDVPLVVIPPECKGQRFCTIKPKGYDLLEDRINSLLPEYLIQDYADRLGDDKSIPNQDDKDYNNKYNCPTIKSSVSPFIMEETNEHKTKTELVIQTKIFKQKVISINCDSYGISKEIEENKPQCFQDIISPNLGLTTICRQTMGSQALYIYDSEKKQILNKTIPVPVACSCYTYHI